MNQDTLKESVFQPKFLQLVRFRRDIFTGCRSLSQFFYHSPDFGTTSLQRVHFWIDDVKCVSDFMPIFHNSSILIRDFHSVSDFEITFLPPSQFLNRKKYNASDFENTLILGEQNSFEIRLHKVNFNGVNLHFTP